AAGGAGVIGGWTGSAATGAGCSAIGAAGCSAIGAAGGGASVRGPGGGAGGGGGGSPAAARGSPPCGAAPAGGAAAARGARRGRGRRGRGHEVLDALVPAVDRLVLVIDIDLRHVRRSGLGVDLDALLGEETSHAAHQALALAKDDRVGTELGTDLGDEILEL